MISGTPVTMYAAAACFGAGDAIVNTLCFARLGQLSEDQASDLNLDLDLIWNVLKFKFAA